MAEPQRRSRFEPQPAWLTLVGAVERLSAADSLADIIEIVRTSACDVSGADGVTFVLREGELCHYVEENAIAPLWKGKQFPLTACVSGWAMLNDKTAVIPDIYLDSRVPQDAYRPTFVQSLVMVPVRTTKPIAAIGFYWAETRVFNLDELALVEALGRAASAAIAAVQLHETLVESEQRLTMALSAGGLGAWELELESKTLSATPAFKEIFGRGSDDDFSYDALIAAVAPDDRERARTVFETPTGERPDKDSEYRIFCPDGDERWIEVRGRAMHDVDGEVTRITGVARDVTDRRQSRERLERTQSELAHIARQNELGQMVSALAHELNQPLTAALNYLSVAERLAPRDTDQAMGAIAKSKMQFDRATAIIHRIRGFVRKGDVARAPADIGEIIGEALELARLDARHRDIAVRVAIGPGLPPVALDKVQIVQVLVNLLRNAFEALDGRTQRDVAVTAAHVAGGLEVRVSDSGPGLPPEIAVNVFKPFQSTKENGMGVGLSLCRSIVEAHGGRMRYEPGDGATFVFTLPMGM
ncbi:MAG: PAS domain S-box protein [Alphaproteobacteria bacterium]|nr:PAS domain S-box protein [Alphaproteobacteria bacterium]